MLEHSENAPATSESAAKRLDLPVQSGPSLAKARPQRDTKTSHIFVTLNIHTIAVRGDIRLVSRWHDGSRLLPVYSFRGLIGQLVSCPQLTLLVWLSPHAVRGLLLPVSCRGQRKIGAERNLVLAIIILDVPIIIDSFKCCDVRPRRYGLIILSLQTHSKNFKRLKQNLLNHITRLQWSNTIHLLVCFLKLFFRLVEEAQFRTTTIPRTLKDTVCFSYVILHTVDRTC